MNALAERAGTQTACPHCGARLAHDQDWCLECGAAVTTRIRAAPDWRVPVAIVGGIVTLAVVGLVLALVALSNTSDRSIPAAAAPGRPAAQGLPATTQPATTRPATTRPATTRPATTRLATTPTTGATTAATTTTPAGATIGSWPTGVTGYTVVLGVIPAKATATVSATRIAAAGIPVGLLYSSAYSSMRPGDWIVFSGTYTTRAPAEAAAARLIAKGQTGAYAFPVVPAG